MIKPYYESSLGKLYCGESLEVLKIFPDNYVETIITDPPYGLSFMGKKWDYEVPSVELWKECLRVLKPGGTALIFTGSRTQHRMACNVEDAGFILKDCIMWLYGSGFPKSLNIGKAIDKLQGNEREFVEKNPNDREVRENNLSDYGLQGGVGKGNITKGTSEWEGWGTALKPAYEPILVAMKQNDGSYAENALKWGVSGLNIDGSRIGTGEDKIKGGCINRKEKPDSAAKHALGNQEVKDKCYSQGRFPANIILDEEAGRLLDLQSGELKSGSMKKPYKYTNNGYSLGAPAGETKQIHESNTGGASRFFYCAKASKAERNRGCGGLEEKNIAYQVYRENVDGTKSFVSCYPDGSPRPMNKPKNNHPTVKPLKLIEYLCNLTKTPTGGTVLDLFAGSGTTGIACEKLGRKWILIEKEKEYCEISAKRIESEASQLKLFR